MNLKTFEIGYERKDITASILHIGVGNFHRAHQAYYTNLLLSYPDQKEWGICGAMILDRDEKIFRGLTKQDGCYGLTAYGRLGNDEHYQIGALVELLWGGEDAAAIINKISDDATKIISLTITEGGYNIDNKSGEFDFSNKDVSYDLQSPETPRTVFGYVASGLRKRIAQNAQPLTILSCDNLVHNGIACRNAFLSFFMRADIQLYNWAKENISFPNSMVDRITPATLTEDISRLHAMNGYEDIVPVYCEDFVQWVIEDDFIAGRPAWERVGVEFTDEVSVYESMKLGYVNSTHQMLAYPGMLAGYRKVDEAVSNPCILAYLKQYMDEDVTPYLISPQNINLDDYKAVFMERLKNKAVSDQLSRLCFDAASRIPVFMKPTITAMIKAGADMKRVSFMIAAYRLYQRQNKDEKGMPYPVDDPALTENDRILIAGDDPLDFLGLSCLSGLCLNDSESFVRGYLASCRDLETKGVMATMAELVE